MTLDFVFAFAVTQQRGAAESFKMFPERLLTCGITHHSFFHQDHGRGVVGGSQLTLGEASSIAGLIRLLISFTKVLFHCLFNRRGSRV